MVNIRQSELTCLKELKFIQLKSYQITSENVGGSGNCLVIEHRNQRIIICCRNELISAPLVSLLNFDVWSKSFLKHVDPNIPSKTVIIIDQVHVSNLISISRKGYGTKLAVACHSPTQPSALIYFYHTDSIEETKEKTVPFNHFNFSVNTVTKIRFISWHPEMNDNIFACSLTDGSFFIIHIGDYPSKTLVVLSQLQAANCYVSTFCWSPKGKQIVISDGTASFVQYKFQLNEQNLVLSNGLQETKKIQLPESFQRFRVSNIFWLSTFNFVIISRNDEADETCFILVSIPSSKATGADAVMKIVDFGRLIIECPEESNESFEGNIFPLENLIFFFTNKSNEFAMIGSTSPELTVADNWSELTNDDGYRLMFSEADQSFQIRGLSFAHGTPKQFQLSTSILKGGIHQPFALAYNSLGHLTLFLIDYENGSEFIKVPTAPKCVKPQVAVQQQPTPPVSTINLQLQPVPMPLIQKSVTATTSSILIGGNNQQQLFSTTTIGSNQTPKLEFNSKQNLFPSSSSMGFNQKPISPESDKVLSMKSQEFSKQTQLQQHQPQKKEGEIVRNIEDLYSEEILNNIKEFDHQLRQSVHSLQTLLRKTTIGSNKKQDRLKFDSKFITEMLENISSSYGSFNHDVNDLQASCLELQYLMEESRTLMDRHNDPKYRHILQQKNLDPLTARRLKEIQALKDYIEIQLRELNNKFDLEWQEWLQRIKLLGSSSTSTSFHNHRHSNSAIRDRSLPTWPHSSFITDEKNNNYENCNIISVGKSKNVSAIVCKALINNQQLIENLKLQIKDLMKKFVDQQGRMPNGSSSFSSCKDSNDLQDLIRLIGNVSLMKSSVVTNLNVTNTSVTCKKERYYRESITVQCMQSDRKISLRNFLENRHSIPIRVCRQIQLGHGSSYTNQKSRFASVLEKIKERRIMLDKKQQKNTSSILEGDKNNETTENKENKIIHTQSVSSQQPRATSITTKPDVVYPAITNSIVANSKLQQQQNSSISQALPQSQPQTTAVVTLPKFQTNSNLASWTIPTDLLHSSSSNNITTTSSHEHKSKESANFGLSTTNTSFFGFGGGQAGDSDYCIEQQKAASTSFPTLSSLISSPTNSTTKPFKDLISTVTSTTSILLPTTTITTFPHETNSSSIVSASHPAAITTQTVTTSSFLTSKIPSFSASMFGTFASNSGGVDSFSNLNISGSKTTPFTSKPFLLKNDNGESDDQNNHKEQIEAAGLNSSKSQESVVDQQRQETVTTTTLNFVTKPSFTFGGTLSKLNDPSKSCTTLTETNKSNKTVYNNLVTTKTEVPITTSKTETISSTSTASAISFVTSANIESSSSLSSALKPSFPSFSSSLFGESKQPSSVTATTVTTAITVAQQSQPSFNFNKTLSSLSLNSGISNTSVVVTTTSTTGGTSIFGSSFGGNLQSSNSHFGQPVASTTSSLFGNSTTTGGFGNFSFGGTTQSNNLFGQQRVSAESSLSPQTKTETLFDQQQPFQPLTNTSPPGPSFSSPHSPPATNVFGGSPLFGGGPTFGSSAMFGGIATFGGEQTASMLSPYNNSNHSFGSMAFKNEPMPSFDSLANDNRNPNSSLAIGFGQPSGGSGGHFFNSTISQQNSDAFTQRRG